MSYHQVKAVLPSGICDGCRTKVASQTSQNPRLLPPRMNYKKLIDDLKSVPLPTRSSPSCPCPICTVVTSAKHHKKIDSACTLYKVSSAPVRGRPRETQPPGAGTSRTYNYCMSQVAKGKTHDCTRTKKFENIQNSLSPGMKEMLASSTIRVKLKGKIQDRNPPGPIALKTFYGGHKLNVSPEAVTSTGARKSLNFSQVSTNAMIKMKIQLNLSNNQTIEASQILREDMGHRKGVEAKFRGDLRSRCTELKDFFEVRGMEFQCSQEGKIVKAVRNMVICTDVKGLLIAICGKRQGTGREAVRIGIDGGGGFLKICANLTKSEDDLRSPTQSPAKKKASRQCCDTGVKKLMILCLINDIPETYDNVKLLLESLLLDEIAFTVASDLKLANILTAIQCHSCAHPCTYCDASPPWSNKGKVRTLGRNHENYRKFHVNGANLNCVHPPLLNNPDETEILDLIPPPELHILLGVVNCFAW